MMKFVETE